MPRWWARANRVSVNLIVVRIAWWMPGLGLLEHVGRRSGRSYRTPLIVLRQPDRYLVVLGYGRDTDWIRNVLAVGEARLRIRRRWVNLTPRILDDEPAHAVPLFARVLGSFGLCDLLELRPPSQQGH